MALKLVWPSLQLTLLEGTGKKVTFLEHMIQLYGLSGVRAVHGRAEELAGHAPWREGFDLVLARAVAPLPILLEYLLPLARVGSTGCLSTTGTLIDVYPFVICGEDAWGQVALRGDKATDPTWIPPGEKSKSDPLGQRGFCGAKFYFACKVLNEGWMAVIEAGVDDLA